MSSPPRLSAIVMVDGQRERGEACLRSLVGQGVDEMEVILLDFAPAGAPDLPSSRHPAVRTVKLTYATGFGGARALGVRMARAPVVAFFEEHVVARPGWAEAVLEAHRGPWAGVGAEVHNPTPGRGLSDLIYLAGYGEWGPPLAAGESRLIPGQNGTFKREALLRFDPELDRLLEADILLQWRLLAGGEKLYHEPGAKIEHRSEGSLRTLIFGYYLVMRRFAPLRAEMLRWPAAKLALRLALVPLGPAYRTARLLWGLFRRRSPHFRKALAGAWAIFGAHLGGAAGEAVGLLAGFSDRDRRFLVYELNADRIGFPSRPR